MSVCRVSIYYNGIQLTTAYLSQASTAVTLLLLAVTKSIQTRRLCQNFGFFYFNHQWIVFKFKIKNCSMKFSGEERVALIAKSSFCESLMMLLRQLGTAYDSLVDSCWHDSRLADSWDQSSSLTTPSLLSVTIITQFLSQWQQENISVTQCEKYLECMVTIVIGSKSFSMMSILIYIKSIFSRQFCLK